MPYPTAGRTGAVARAAPCGPAVPSPLHRCVVGSGDQVSPGRGWKILLRSGDTVSWRSGRWRALRVVCAALAVVLTLSGPSVPAGASNEFVLLQMNLCNSGRAIMSCYSSGRAVDEAVGKIHRYRPQLVTLQEVCRDDLYGRHGWGKLARAMADLYGTERVAVNFAPIFNRDANEGFRCVNDEMYGVATIHHHNGRDPHHGWYGSQDGSDELRVWACDTVIVGKLTGCTTHLSTDREVAVRQCRELMAILSSSWVMPQVIVAGDVNLRDEPDKPHNARDCASAAYERRSDGGLQHVFFTRSIRWVRGNVSAMRWTDHPLLYQSFRL